MVLVGALVLSWLLRMFVFQAFEVPSGSMENTLQISDQIYAQKITAFHRGDVVVFKDTLNWLGEHNSPGPVRAGLEAIGILPDTSRGYLTKRVIGMPGDRIRCCDVQGRVSVNGYPLDEDYLYADAGGRVRPSQGDFDVTVPADRLFLLGDHRNASKDSRCYLKSIALDKPKGATAFVPVDDVVGAVGLVGLPLNHFHTLTTPGTFAGVPPGQTPPAEAVIAVDGGCGT